MGDRLRGWRLFCVFVVFLSHFSCAIAADTQIRIGVFAYRGNAAVHKQWDAHAAYLTHALPGHRFEVVALSREQLDQAAKDNQVQFVITNTGHYSELEHTGLVTRIATRRMAGPMGVLDRFGGVVIARADRTELNTYADLKGKRILTPDAKGFGGWLMHLREALQQGIDLRTDLGGIVETHNQEAVVSGVLAGKSDAGFIRSDLLESMASEGKIRLDQFRVVNARHEIGYPYLLSTRLYPEWALARVNGTSEELAKAVLIALFELPPENAVMRSAGMHSWTIPLNYSPVDELFRETRTGPYANQPVSLKDVLRQHWRLAMGLLILLLAGLSGGLLHGMALNRRLRDEIRRRSEIENSLDESERRFRSMADAMPTLIWMAGPDRQFNFFNQGWLDFTGRSSNQELGEGWLEGIHPDDREYCTTTLTHAFMNRQPLQMEYRMRHASGEYRWVTDFGAPRVAANGTFLGYAGYCTDISAYKHMQETLAAREEEFRSLVSNIPGVVYRRGVDRGRTVLFISDHIQALAGFPATDFTDGKRGYDQLIHPDDLLRVEQSIMDHIGEQEGFILEYRIVDAAGLTRWVLESGHAHYADDGEPRWLDGVFFDVTDLKAAEDQLRQAAIVFENTAEGIMITNAAGLITAVNQAFTEITGYTEEDARGKNPSLLASGRHDPDYFKDMWNTLLESGRWQGEVWDRRKNGEIFPVWQTISTVRDINGVITGYVSVFSDITHVKQAEERLQRLAYHDALTGLPNRMLFDERLEHAIQQAVRHNERLAVLYFDLDRFKGLNDSLGHQVGDELLEAIAARLSLRLRKSDTLSRRGGDEFTVLIETLHEPEQAANVARDILQQLSLPFNLPSGHQVVSGSSIGISLFPEDGQSASQLIKCADKAMYDAKENGRGQYRFYTHSLTTSSRRRMDLGGRLRQAIEQDTLQLVYQPLYDVTSGRLVGTEALMRWSDVVWGPVDPEELITIAEECGLVGALGEWSLRKACTQAMTWQRSGTSRLHVSVNIAPQHLRQPQFAAMVQTVLDDSGLSADLLELEVGEASLLGLGEREIEALRGLQKLGTSITVDDFGIGYSSLSRLHHLPVNRLKIDRSFVRDIPMNEDDMETVSVIVAMAKTLRLEVTAEGVETEEQMRFIKAHHCDAAQGFLLSRPVTPDKIPELVHSAARLDTYNYPP